MWNGVTTAQPTESVDVSGHEILKKTSSATLPKPTFPRPRRMNSLSDALELLGSSFYNVYDKHIHYHRKKLSTPCMSTHSLNDAVSGQWGQSDPILVLNKNMYHRYNRPSLKAQSLPCSRQNSVQLPCDCDPGTGSHPDSGVDSGQSATTLSPKPARRLKKIHVEVVTEKLLKHPLKNKKIPHFAPESESESGESSISEENNSLHARFAESEKPHTTEHPRQIWFGEATESALHEAPDVPRNIRFPRRDSMAPTSLQLKNLQSLQDHQSEGETQQIMQTASFPSENPVLHRAVDDLIFDMFCEHDEEVVHIGKFLTAIESTGLLRTDPRLKELFSHLRELLKTETESGSKTNRKRHPTIESLHIDRDSFKRAISENIVLISRAFRQQFVVPSFKMLCDGIEEIYEKCKDVPETGHVATYIPQLARVNPDFFGVSICTIDGQRFSIGDTKEAFTLQSCSKPLTYAIALNEVGEDVVHEYVGQEPSGRMFNELVLDHNKKPHNPMVNAGAIIVASIVHTLVRPELTSAEKFDFTQKYFKKLGGGEFVGFNNAVFLSEREAADRNYALGFYMREHNCFPEGTNMRDSMDYYFQCCSMETNCETASVMAATLANGGICPTTGDKVFNTTSVRNVLSLMHSCGMYDYSGQFAFNVGLPAKSGVSGCIILVVPNVLGMAIWSPSLDSLGNSSKGVSFCEQLVDVFNFHKYDNLRHASDKLDPRRHRHETKGLNIVNLLFSAASGDVSSMRRHHLSGMDMSACDYDGRTALHLAAAEGHLECVEYLLAHCKVVFNAVDRWGNFPVNDAERFGHEDVVDFLQKWKENHTKKASV